MSDIGLLVSAKFPYTDGSGAKTRPGLVIGEYLRDCLLVPVSKEVLKYANEPASVILDNDGLESGRLKHPSPFGFLITRKDEADFTRNDITAHLEQHNIQTRNLFAGNLTRHPCFDHLAAGKDYRLIGELENTDKIMNDSFWIGVYPGMTESMLQYMADAIKAFVGFGQDQQN